MGSGCSAVGNSGKGVDTAGLGWQAEARKEAKMIIHKRRLINFMSVSFKFQFQSISTHRASELMDSRVVKYRL